MPLRVKCVCRIRVLTAMWLLRMPIACMGGSTWRPLTSSPSIPNVCLSTLNAWLTRGALICPLSDWPRPGELGDLPTGVTISWTFFPYTEPGGTFEGSPVVLQCHEGDWRGGAALDRPWFEASLPIVSSRRHWLRRETELVDTPFTRPRDSRPLLHDLPADVRFRPLDSRHSRVDFVDGALASELRRENVVQLHLQRARFHYRHHARFARFKVH